MKGGNALEQHWNNIITKYIQLKKKKKPFYIQVNES